MIMTNSTNNISRDISMNGQRLEEVTSFKYLGATLCKDSTCSAEVHIRIIPAMAAMVRLNRVWQCNLHGSVMSQATTAFQNHHSRQAPWMRDGRNA